MYEAQYGNGIASAPRANFFGAPAPNDTPEACDPRETGNHIARLQVANELVDALRRRASSIADRINSAGLEGKQVSSETHMSLLRFPDDIIAAAKEAHIHLNRIEGALGV